MNTADPTLDTRIAAFAAAVRAHLDDLDPEIVDDLTGGLEADLQEEAADHDGELRLGDPVRYAEELRTSAGLPERAIDAAPDSPLAQLRQRIEQTGREVLRTARGNRELSAIVDLLIVFRPVWWLLRAWAGYQCALILFVVLLGSSHPFLLLPGGPLGWLLLAGLTVISVQWGRGRWAANRVLRASRTTVSVATALSLLLLVPLALTESAGQGYVDESAYSTPAEQPGLSLDGKAITNLFAYDAEGELLDRVQLFDQDGEPLTTVSGIEQDGRIMDPTTGEYPEPADGAWNAYPLERDMLALGDGSAAAGSGLGRPPFAKALPLTAGGRATPTPVPSADGAPGTDGSAEPAPTPEPTP